MARAVRLLTEVSAVDRAFDYRLPETMATVGVGDRLRVDFHGRSVRGWVLDEVPDAPELKTVKSWLGYGPPPAMAPLFEWAARRWCAPLASFYRSASDVRLHKSLPTDPAALAVPDVVAREPGVWQLAPTTDPIDIVLAAYESTRGRGSLLVLTPTDAWAERLAARLRRRGLFVAQGEQAWPQARAGWPVVVGARGVAFAPLPTVEPVVPAAAGERVRAAVAVELVGLRRTGQVLDPVEHVAGRVAAGVGGGSRGGAFDAFVTTLANLAFPKLTQLVIDRVIAPQRNAWIAKWKEMYAAR